MQRSTCRQQYIHVCACMEKTHQENHQVIMNSWTSSSDVKSHSHSGFTCNDMNWNLWCWDLTFFQDLGCVCICSAWFQYIGLFMYWNTIVDGLVLMGPAITTVYKLHLLTVLEYLLAKSVFHLSMDGWVWRCMCLSKMVSVQACNIVRSHLSSGHVVKIWRWLLVYRSINLVRFTVRMITLFLMNIQSEGKSLLSRGYLWCSEQTDPHYPSIFSLLHETSKLIATTFILACLPFIWHARMKLCDFCWIDSRLNS